MLPENPKLVVEFLFWKSAKDVNAIESGYDDNRQRYRMWVFCYNAILFCHDLVLADPNLGNNV